MIKNLQTAGMYAKSMQLREEAGEGSGGSATQVFDSLFSEDNTKSDEGGASAANSEGGKSGVATSTEGGNPGTTASQEGQKAEGGAGNAEGGQSGSSSEVSFNPFEAAAESGSQEELVQVDAKVVSHLFKDLELELKEGTEASYDALKESFKQKLDSSRKQVDLDGYNNPNAKKLVLMLEEGKDIKDFLFNETINQANQVIATPLREKVVDMKEIQMINLGMSEEEAAAKAEELVKGLSPEQLKKEADAIDKYAQDSITAEIERMHNEHLQFTKSVDEKNSKQKEQERNQLVQAVNGLTEFLGYSITDAAKANIIKQINDGTFHRTILGDKPTALLNAYMMMTAGKSILSHIEKTMKDSGNENFMQGMKKVMEILPKEGKSKKSAEGNSGASATSNFSFL